MSNIGALSVQGNQYVTFLKSEGFRIASNIPDPPEHLVPREEKLKELNGKLSTTPAIVVSTVQALGEGGQGKSVLATLYANRYRNDYKLGRRILNCSGRSPVEVLSELVPPDEKGQLTSPELAQVARALLCSDPGYVIILDNIDDEAHWAEYLEDKYRLSDPCRVIVTCRCRLQVAGRVDVDALTAGEAIDLLKQFRPSANLAEHRADVLAIVQETAGLAVLVAAIGATMDRRHSDDWKGRLDKIRSTLIEKIPRDPNNNYPHSTEAILDSLFESLSGPEQWLVRFASLLPRDRIREDWLLAFLKDAFGDGWLQTTSDEWGEAFPPAYHVECLKELAVMRLAASDDSYEKLYSLHRLHGRRTRERMSPAESESCATAARRLASRLVDSGIEAAQYSANLPLARGLFDQSIELLSELPAQEDAQTSLLNSLAASYMNRGNVRQDLGDLSGAVEDCGVAIDLRAGLRSKLGSFWTPEMQNELASSYLNRGNARMQLGDLSGAVEDHGVAIDLRARLRSKLGSFWTPEMQNDFGRAHMSRGNSRMRLGDLSGAVEDYGVAIDLREALRSALGSSWLHAMQSDLSSAYLNRGNGRMGIGDLSGAVEDCGVAIEHLEFLRSSLGTSLPPGMQNNLAVAYLNRSNARQGLGDLSGAVEDCGVAIEHMESVRLLLGSSWPPGMQNDLANSHVSRGCARGNLGDLSEAVEDFGVAIDLMEALRSRMGTSWMPRMRSDLRTAYRNRSIAYKQAGARDLAAEDLTKAAELDDDPDKSP